ncbi:MAG: VOC family protein [Methylacidiphilales bacterium]|nr:VOC family protein [Candidatus Methylacidiphilales bacterium]
MKLNAKRLNHVTIAAPAGEHAKVRAFYGDLLGLEEVPRPDALNAVYDLMWFKFLDILLHIDFSPPWNKPAENRHIALEIEDLPSLRRYLESKNATIREAVVMPDRDRFYLLDPFGNYFELLEMKK